MVWLRGIECVFVRIVYDSGVIGYRGDLYECTVVILR